MPKRTFLACLDLVSALLKIRREKAESGRDKSAAEREGERVKKQQVGGWEEGYIDRKGEAGLLRGEEGRRERASRIDERGGGRIVEGGGKEDSKEKREGGGEKKNFFISKGLEGEKEKGEKRSGETEAAGTSFGETAGCWKRTWGCKLYEKRRRGGGGRGRSGCSGVEQKSGWANGGPDERILYRRGRRGLNESLEDVASDKSCTYIASFRPPKLAANESPTRNHLQRIGRSGS